MKQAPAVVVLILINVLVASAQLCGPQSMARYQKLLAPDLRYHLLDYFSPARFCDPDCLGPCNLIKERTNAENIVSELQKDTVALGAIKRRLSLLAIDRIKPDDKLKIYREYKRLSCAVNLKPYGKLYKFIVPAANGLRIEGEIDAKANITVNSRESTILACPK